MARVNDILAAVGGTPTGLTVKGIARRTGVGVSTTYRLVRTLTYDRYLLRWEPGGFFTLGPAILDLACDLSAQLSYLTHDTPPAKLAERLNLPPDQISDLLAKAAACNDLVHCWRGQPPSGSTRPDPSQPASSTATEDGE